MKSSKLWISGLVVLLCLANLPAAQAQYRGRGLGGLVRRTQQMQQQQAKQAQAAQKAYMEWAQKAQAEAAQKMAAHRADLARKKAQAEVDREATIAKNKQHNIEAARKLDEKMRAVPKSALDAKVGSKDKASAQADDVDGESEMEMELEDPESGEKEVPAKAVTKATTDKKQLTASTNKPAVKTTSVKK